MTLRVEIVQPHVALPVLARLYGCSVQNMTAVTDQIVVSWIVQTDEQKTLGAIAARPSPSHEAEIMGEAFPGSRQHEAALALMRSALAEQPHLYAYAEAHLLPITALEAAGLHLVSAYTRMTGLLPALSPVIPDGFRVVSGASPCPRRPAGGATDILESDWAYPRPG